MVGSFLPEYFNEGKRDASVIIRDEGHDFQQPFVRLWLLVCQKQNNIILGCFEVGREPSDETPPAKNKIKILSEIYYCMYITSHEK